LAALNLDRNRFSARALRDFVKSPLLGNLRWLSLQGPRVPVPRTPGEIEQPFHREFRLGDAAAEAFADAPRASGLVYLDLGNQRITDDGLRALAESSHLGNLMTLRLWHNEIGRDDLWNSNDPLRCSGVSDLVVSDHLQRLVDVDLRSNPLPPVARLALRQRFGYGGRYGPGRVLQGRNFFAERFTDEEGDVDL
jgi:hypothetical protein